MKVILEGGAGSAILREQRLARFLEESQITGQLDHPGIVPIHELGVDEQGRVYFTMKLVQGRTLEEVIAEAARGGATGGPLA
jgi:serine/threonine-protein kinase